jgi:hypothetical protein
VSGPRHTGGEAIRHATAESPTERRLSPTDGTRRHGPMLSDCVIPGCGTLTMGGTCVKHDTPLSVTFARGRTHVPVP